MVAKLRRHHRLCSSVNVVELQAGEDVPEAGAMRRGLEHAGAYGVRLGSEMTRARLRCDCAHPPDVLAIVWHDHTFENGAVHHL